jgi:hypothetical protein
MSTLFLCHFKVWSHTWDKPKIVAVDTCGTNKSLIIEEAKSDEKILGVEFWL